METSLNLREQEVMTDGRGERDACLQTGLLDSGVSLTRCHSVVSSEHVQLAALLLVGIS